MIHWIVTRNIEHAPVLGTLYGLGVLAALFLLARPWTTWTRGRRGAHLPGRARRAAAWWIVPAAGALGLGLGYAVCWLTGDVWDLFGIDLTWTTRMWVAFAFAGTGLAVANLIPLRGSRLRWPRAVAALLAVPLFVVMAAAGVNVNFGAYSTIRAALGKVPYGALDVKDLHTTASPLSDPVSGEGAQADLLATWRPDNPLPRHGKVGTVRISGPGLHYTPRLASIYLPPAIDARNVPDLPVIIALSGQPGEPSDMFASGKMPEILNGFADAHHGLAPIVVVPDQLGARSRNPMCVNSPLGRVATYITRDVPRWIHDHLPAATGREHWAVAGFSEGGTCSIQFAAGYPRLFGTFLDISGQVEPTMGPQTVAVAFHGSEAAYDAAKPLTLLAEHAPFSDTVGYFGVGAADGKYYPQSRIVSAAAARAGITTHFLASPGTAHDWHTVRYVMGRDLPRVSDRLFDGL